MRAATPVVRGTLNTSPMATSTAIRRPPRKRDVAFDAAGNIFVADGYVTDSSSKNFQASYEEFTQGAKKTIEGLDGMASYLNQAAATFRDADTQLASALGR